MKENKTQSSKNLEETYDRFQSMWVDKNQSEFCSRHGWLKYHCQSPFWVLLFLFKRSVNERSIIERKSPGSNFLRGFLRLLKGQSAAVGKKGSSDISSPCPPL